MDIGCHIFIGCLTLLLEERFFGEKSLIFVFHSDFYGIIATLGSILDTQLSRESGKFHLARWSHGVALLLSYQLGINHVCVIVSRRRDSITSVWYYISLNNLKYHVSMILSQRRDTLKISKFLNFKKSEKILLLQIKFELKFLKVFT